MMECLQQIVCRLAQDPTRIAELVKERSVVSDQLYNILDAIKEREFKFAGDVAERRKQDGTLVFPNSDLRAAETLRLLTVNSEYQNAKNTVEETRRRLQDLDAEIELTGRRNNADQKIIALVTAFISNGTKQEAHGILNAYKPEGIASTVTTSQNTAVYAALNQTNSSGSQSGVSTEGQNGGVFLVLEARPGKSPETIRAYCEGSDGKKVAVYAKNGNGQMLLRCLGKRVKIECTPDDKGLIAYKVEPVA